MTRKKACTVRAATGYDAVLADVVALIDAGRRAVVRTSNAIAKLETFLLELGGDFTFVGRQRRLRVADAWYPLNAWQNFATVQPIHADQSGRGRTKRPA